MVQVIVTLAVNAVKGMVPSSPFAWFRDSAPTLWLEQGSQSRSMANKITDGDDLGHFGSRHLLEEQ
jgi:hypothetical protein